ncbi:MAG: hypothetical protein QGG48_12335, partial [Desulfatiglandales bacterium]|nr:hypothetical protein [Desulfatiglandales bacterium]
HIADISHPEVEHHIDTTINLLDEIGAADIPRLLVLNKVDLLHDPMRRFILEKKFPGSVIVSAFDQESNTCLIEKIKHFFADHFSTYTLKLPYSRCDSLSKIYEESIVDNVSYHYDGIYVDCTISHSQKEHFIDLINPNVA